jgi:hypothetical protein
LLGGSGMYEGASGWLTEVVSTNPVRFTFHHKGKQRRNLMTTEATVVVPKGEKRCLENRGKTVVTGFVGPQPEAVEILAGTDSIFGNGTSSPATGTFTLSCMAVGYLGFDIVDACLLYFNWHSVEEGLICTTDSLVANGMAIMTDMEDISKPFYQKYLILGGTGKYAGVTGWIDSDYVINPGFDTFVLHINDEDTTTLSPPTKNSTDSTTTIPPATIPPTGVSSTTTTSEANRLSGLFGIASLMAWSMVLF